VEQGQNSGNEIHHRYARIQSLKIRPTDGDVSSLSATATILPNLLGVLSLDMKVGR